jgi:hypothetical protein
VKIMSIANVPKAILYLLPDCKAGQNSRSCKHIGAVMLRLGLEEEIADSIDDPSLGGLYPGGR